MGQAWNPMAIESALCKSATQIRQTETNYPNKRIITNLPPILRKEWIPHASNPANFVQDDMKAYLDKLWRYST